MPVLWSGEVSGVDDLLEDGDGEFTELVDADIPRVDLVGKGANGRPFLIAKSQPGGVLSADYVRDLISKAEPDEKEPVVTVSGTPAAIAAMIHSAPVRKAASDNDAANADAAAAVAGDNEPLPDADTLMGDAADAADGSGVPAKADGDPDDPQSPAWESVDAARARQAVQLAVALRRMVCLAQDREAQEAAGGDLDDAEQVFALGDVLSAVDCILSVLAPFAVTEQAEADQRQAQIDEWMNVTKAGRVLSAANEAAIRQASDALQKVLATLPAPVEDGDEVAKSEEVPVQDDVTKAEPETPAEAGDANVEKAKGDPQVAVYTADGKLVGVVDQADISPIAAPTAPDGGDAQGGAAADSDGSDDSSATTDTGAPADANDGPAAAAPVEPTPAPAPADDDVTKGLSDQQVELMKSIFSNALEAAVAPLQKRLAEVEAQPMPGGPLLNGAGLAGVQLALRGQQEGTEDPHAELRKQAAEATDPVQKAALQEQLATAQMKSIFTQGR